MTDVMENNTLLRLDKAARYVESGAAWLDEVAPEWDAYVSLDRLDLSSGTDDVLGQIAHHFLDDDSEGNGYSRWTDYPPHGDHLSGYVAPPEGTYCDECATDDCGCIEEMQRVAAYGFDSTNTPFSYITLTLAWQRLIRDRRDLRG